MNTTAPAYKSRAYIRGMAIGTFWLLAAGAGSAEWAMVAVKSNLVALIAVSVIAVILLALNLRQIIAALKLPADPPSARRRIAGKFALIVVLEILAIALINVACYLTGHRSWVVPLDLIVVGIHFIPLAILFGVPRYTILGLLFCAASVLTLLLVPAHARIGKFMARDIYPAFGCVAATWLISVGNLLELRRRIDASKVVSAKEQPARV